MRLLNVHTFRLEDFADAAQVPPYAILSHRWGEGEVLFDDFRDQPHLRQIAQLRSELKELKGLLTSMQAQRLWKKPARSNNAQSELDDSEDLFFLARNKAAWPKVKRSCEEALKLGLHYIWIDTCCIDQKSSSDLSESINSMFAWYRDARVCIAYLSDVSKKSKSVSDRHLASFDKSQWFQRGWTLQELIAPTEVCFYDRTWSVVGTRCSLAEEISAITGVDQHILTSGNLRKLKSFSVATRLSWAAGRQTTRPEDRAYSLMGLFGVNMPTLYGEGGTAAFFRLQCQIFQTIPDLSILAWTKDLRVDFDLFAESPDDFDRSRGIQDSLSSLSTDYFPPELHAEITRYERPLFSVFSHGIRIRLLVLSHVDKKRANDEGHVLNAFLGCRNEHEDAFVGIHLKQTTDGNFKRRGTSLTRFQVDWYRDPETRVHMTDVYVLNPGRALSPYVMSTVFFGGIITFAMQADLHSYGLEMGQCSGPITRTASDGQVILRVQTMSLKIFEKYLGGGVWPARENHAAIVFRVLTTDEIFAVMLRGDQFRSQAIVKIDLAGDAFHKGYRPTDLTESDWQDLRMKVVHERLPGGKVVYVGVNRDGDKEEKTDRVILTIGVHD